MPSARPRLVGRRDEMAALEDEFARAAAGEFRVVLLLGEAGVGKSRLGRELLARHPEAAGMFGRAHPLGVTAAFGLAAAVQPGGWLLIEDADYMTFVAADPAHPRSARFDQVMRKLLTFFSVSRAFDPFFARRLPLLMAALGLADSRSEAIACHRQGGSGEAEFLRRSLERMRTPILDCGVAAEEEFEAVLAATADTSFSFVDALSVAAWARNPD